MEKTLSKRFIPGVTFQENGTGEVVVWAPSAEEVALLITDPQREKIPLQEREYGYWSASVEGLRPGSLYYILIEGQQYPDPASRFQPEDVHGPSQVVDLRQLEWTDGEWRGLPMEEMIIYELHVGTFTPEGTFDGVIKKLDYLTELGVNALEIMPVAQFPGGRNWGYDGVFPYAVQRVYGGVEGLNRLVDACHEKGLAVILDVVFNHLGPEGNVLMHFGPYFTGKYKTPWGKAVNFDDAHSDGVRQYWIQNALMWLRDFHIDGLRLDAVHAIKDFGAKHFLKELKEQVIELENSTGRNYELIAECDLNDVRYLDPFPKGGYNMDAQWTDEFHHALHALVTGEQNGYYEDFGDIRLLEKSYRDAYVYDGIYSPHRKKTFGSSTDDLQGQKFVVFSQNHDQVGNRMLGDRLSTLVSFEMQKLLAGAVFVSPFVPLLFMGEEYGETHPFLYFVSHQSPELIEAVRKGRKAEFAAFHREGEAPDPQAEETFKRSKLSWNYRETGGPNELWQFYRKLIDLKKHHPVLKSYAREGLETESDPERNVLILERRQNGSRLICFQNYSTESRQGTLPRTEEATWGKLLDSAEEGWAGPGSTAPGYMEGGQTLELPPESIIIYTTPPYE